MSDKVKHVYFNKFMREFSERHDLDKYIQEVNEMSPEDLLKENQRVRKELQEIKAEADAIQDPETMEWLKEISELQESIDLDSELNVKEIKIMELVNEKIKAFGEKHPIGALDRKGVFLCGWCLTQEKYDDPISLIGFETIIYVYDVTRLKAGSFYQCDDCKKKFGLNGITD